MSGYVKLWRSADFWELIKDHKAFALASVIAVRARRIDGLNRHRLEVGEALLGDYETFGMTQGEYRAAKKRLEDMGFATFCTTNKGTIARLINTGVFDPNCEWSDEPHDRPATNNLQRASNERHDRPATNGATTNKYKKGIINEKTNEKDLCAEPEKPDSEPEDVFLIFNCTGSKREFSLTRSKVEQYRQTFDTVNIEAEVKKAWQWLEDNPVKRKTAGGVPRFLNSWLSKAANEGSAPKRASYGKLERTVIFND